jgi:hypothetical protein
LEGLQVVAVGGELYCFGTLCCGGSAPLVGGADVAGDGENEYPDQERSPKTPRRI